MADSKIKEGEAQMSPAVQSTTSATPHEADETSMPNALNTDSEMPPVRTGAPGTPIAQTMAAGAGSHDPPDPKVWGPDGRLIADPADAGKK